jgi:hypothetical protein
MEIIEYRVKVPDVPMNGYSSLLTSALASENTNIVTILQSGESDYANLPGRNNNKLHSGIHRINKNYKIPIANIDINVKSFIKNDTKGLTSKSHINSNIAVTSRCSNLDNIENIFSLPLSLLPSRTVVPLDLTNPDVWNFVSPVVTPIISLPSPLPVPTTTPDVFVYIMFIISSSNTEQVLDTTLFKAYIILLHKKIVSLIGEN